VEQRSNLFREKGLCSLWNLLQAAQSPTNEVTTFPKVGESDASDFRDAFARERFLVRTNDDGGDRSGYGHDRRNVR